MKFFKAALWKDFKVFKSGTGLLSLLLPLALALAVSIGGADSAKKGYIEPFPIAVRDNDKTVMSRSLTRQISQVELFSDVIKAADYENDEDLLNKGAAAVITIPKDFFYNIYSFENSPVHVSLNESMPLESSVLSSVFVSVMDIIGTNQATANAVYGYCFGDALNEQTQELWAQTANSIVNDALGRHKIFSADAELSGIEKTVKANLLASCLCVLCIFFAISGVKTLPEEISLGILQRYIAAGGSIKAFLLSKLLMSALLALPSAILLALIFSQGSFFYVMFIAAVIFSAAFSVMLCMAAYSKDVSSVQRLGNIFLLLSLVLGGSLYSNDLLSYPVKLLSKAALPHYILSALSKAEQNKGILSVMLSLAPVMLAAAIFTAIALYGFNRQAASRCRLPFKSVKVNNTPKALRIKPNVLRVFTVGLAKCMAMSNGAGAIICLLAAVFLCGVTASSALGFNEPSALSIGIAIQGENPHAHELKEKISAASGVTVYETTLAEGEELLSSGKIEGLLILEESYSSSLEKGENFKFTYKAATASSSSGAAREIIAGQAAAQRARFNGVLKAEELTGTALLQAEKNELLSLIDKAQASLPPLFYIKGFLGMPLPEKIFAPSLTGFALLAAALALFTWASWMGRADVKRVEERLAALPFGRSLSLFSDAAALWLIGLITVFAALLPGGMLSLKTVCALILYIFCVSGLALALTRFTAVSGRIDAWAPFIAIITCMLGGCFGDISNFVPALKILSLCTPQGLAINAAATGNVICFLTLAALGACFTFAACFPYSSKKHSGHA